MKENKPKWYDRMATDPMPGKTLPMELVRKIEKKAMEGGHPPLRKDIAWISGLAMAAVVTFILLSPGLPNRWLSTLTQSGLGGTESPAHVTGDPTPSSAIPTGPVSSPSPPRAPLVFRLKGSVDAFARPEAFGVQTTLFTALPEQAYEVLKTEGKFAKISYNGLSGWIPEWYLEKESAGGRIVEVPPYEMLLADTVKFALYPGEAEPSGFGLQAGKVVQVTKEYGDWVAVAIKTYDSPYMGDKWLPKSALAAFDPARAKEGRVKEGAAVYNEEGGSIERPPGDGPIFIEGETGGRFRFIAPGGYTGYIDKKDFIPNPFEESSEGLGWNLSPDKIKLFQSFQAQPSDAILRNLEPIDIFRFYVDASQLEDHKTQYALYMRDEQSVAPPEEVYLHDVARDPEGVQMSKRNWENWRKEYRLEQRIDGDSALIILTKKDAAARKAGDAVPDEEQIGFGLTRNKDGIWKVNWQPLQ